MDLIKKHCVPCEGGTPPFSESQEDEYLEKVDKWSLIRDGEHKIRKQFTFKDFKEALEFVNKVGALAEEASHHPDIELGWGRVKVTLVTHSEGKVTAKDHDLAQKIDEL